MARTTADPVRTLYRGTNADLLVDVARLYIPDGALVADITWGTGVFWKKTDASRFTLLGSDIDPARIREAAGVDAPQFALFTLPTPAFLVADCTHLPYREQSLDVVVVDPPYVHTPGGQFDTMAYNNATTKGMYHRDILRELYCRAILEAARVLKPAGLLLVKGKDEVESGRQRWSRDELPRAARRCGFTDQDMFVYEAQTGFPMRHGEGQAPQQHARKNHSYLFVFTLTDSPCLAAHGRPRKGSVVTTLNDKRGTGYLWKRLVRDAPSIYAKYMAGELPSVHAAAVAAGLVRARPARTAAD
jgi:hypothetical protein